MKISISKSLTSNKGVGDPTLLWDLDFTAQTYRYNRVRYPAVTDLPATTFTRATQAWGYNASGALVSFSAGTPRATDAGLTVEAAATNVVPNSAMTGATSSTLPTGMSFQAAAGLTQTVVGIGNEYGLPYVDWSIVGTTSGVVYPTLFLTGTGASAPAASNGQTWTGSVYYRVVSGVIPTGMLAVGTQIFNGAAYLSSLSESSTSAATGLTRLSTTGTIANAATTNSSMYVGSPAGVANGTVVSVIIRIYAPQLEQGTFATTPCLTTGTAVTRNADALTSADTVISPTIVAEFTVPLAGSSIAHVWQQDDGTDTNRVTCYYDRSAGRIYGLVQVGGVAQAALNIGAVAPGATAKVAMRVALNDFSASLNGAACVMDASGTLPTVTSLWVGGRSSVGNNWGAGIRRIRRYSVAKTNAELQALST